MRRRKTPRIYDEGIYLDFGKQSRPLELQIGYGLIPFVSKAHYQDDDIPLLSEFSCVRLEPYEYKILLHGIDVGGFKSIMPGDVFCLNTDSVTVELAGEKVKEPAFGMDGIIVDKDKAEEAEKLGYLLVEPERIISTHLREIIKKNITKFMANGYALYQG